MSCEYDAGGHAVRTTLGSVQLLYVQFKFAFVVEGLVPAPPPRVARIAWNRARRAARRAALSSQSRESRAPDVAGRLGTSGDVPGAQQVANSV